MLTKHFIKQKLCCSREMSDLRAVQVRLLDFMPEIKLM